MKNHHEFTPTGIGASDSAELTLIAEDGAETKMHFEEDGVYRAYIVDQNTKIPDYYKKVAEFKNTMKIRDDEKITVEVDAKEIKVFRAGRSGCIIQMIEE